MAWLVCTNGPDKGIQLELTEQMLTIGRSPDNGIRLIEEKASRFHCNVRLHESKLELEDLNSTNGTKCHARRLRGQKAELKLGESFAIGKDVFEFRRGPDRTIAAELETEQAVPAVPIERGREQTRFESQSSDMMPLPKRPWWAIFRRQR